MLCSLDIAPIVVSWLCSPPRPLHQLLHETSLKTNISQPGEEAAFQEDIVGQTGRVRGCEGPSDTRMEQSLMIVLLSEGTLMTEVS